MPWKVSNIMDERVRFISRLLEGKRIIDLYREFKISRKTGYKFGSRYMAKGVRGLVKVDNIEKLWRNKWPNLIPIFDYPDEIRKAIYTTNAIESLNSVIRKAIKNNKIFPNDDSALELIYLAVNRASQKWSLMLGLELLLRTSRYGHGNTLKIRPPLILSKGEADQIVERLEKCFSEIL